MHKCLETHNLLRLNQEGIENLSRKIRRRSNQKSKTSQHRKAQDQMTSLVKSTKYLWWGWGEELMPIFLKPFQNIKEVGTLPNSFYKASITLTIGI